MSHSVSRRDALKQLGPARAGMLFGGTIRGQSAPIVVAGRRIRLR